ncbi:hypothetical protein QE152_g4368 [Popillia japonica]|uniref:Integrase catalytic domain-containing protein n=1 Tax=Popillia japonica TaxID=7064 RepID=A0AAW1MVG6_POPJA
MFEYYITTPYNPNSNSNIERVHSTLAEHVRILREKEPKEDIMKLMKLAIIAYNNTIMKLMKLAIIAYNNTIHTTTGLTPLELTFGHTKTHDPFDICYDRTFYNNYLTRHINRLKLLYTKLGDRVQENKTKIIEKRNTNFKTQPLEIGQQVYVKQPIGYKSKINPRFSGPYNVKKIFENGTAIVIPRFSGAYNVKKIFENGAPYNVKKIFENGTAIVIDKNKRERKVHVRNLKYGVVTDSSPRSQDQPGTSN